VCKDEKANCHVTADAIINLCIAPCDPLIQDCPGDGLCIPIGDTFVCAPDASPPDVVREGHGAAGVRAHRRLRAPRLKARDPRMEAWQQCQDVIEEAATAMSRGLAV